MKKVLSILVVLTIFSCADLRKSEQLERIDEIIVTLDKIEIELSLIDSTQIIEFKNRSIEVDDLLLNLLNDTIPYEMALKLDSFKKMASKINPLEIDCQELKEAFYIQYKSVIALKDDISEGAGQRHKYDQYIEMEQTSVNVLKHTVEGVNGNYVELEENFRSMYEEIIEDVNTIIQNRTE